MKRLSSALVIIIFLLTISACLIPGAAHAEDSVYTDQRYGFSIRYPSGCRTLINYRGSALIIVLAKVSPFFTNNVIVTVAKGSSMGRPLEELIDIYFKYDGTVSEKKKVTINNIKFLSVVQTQTKSFWFFKLKLKLYHLIAVKGNRMYTITYNATPDSYDKYLALAKKTMHTFKFIE